MFLDDYGLFAQIGILVSLIIAPVVFCCCVPYVVSFYYVCLKPFTFLMHLCCKCECRDKNGSPIETESDWNDYTLRCPCVGDDEDEAFKV